MGQLRAVPIEAKFIKDWLHPANMSLLQKAVKAEQDRVTLVDGKTYAIEYGHEYRSNYDGVHKGIMLKPTNGDFVPMGFVRMKRILDFDFEGTDHESE